MNRSIRRRGNQSRLSIEYDNRRSGGAARGAIARARTNFGPTFERSYRIAVCAFGRPHRSGQGGFGQIAPVTSVEASKEFFIAGLAVHDQRKKRQYVRCIPFDARAVGSR